MLELVTNSSLRSGVLATAFVTTCWHQSSCRFLISFNRRSVNTVDYHRAKIVDIVSKVSGVIKSYQNDERGLIEEDVSTHRDSCVGNDNVTV